MYYLCPNVFAVQYNEIALFDQRLAIGLDLEGYKQPDEMMNREKGEWIRVGCNWDERRPDMFYCSHCHAPDPCRNVIKLKAIYRNGTCWNSHSWLEQTRLVN